MATKKKPEFDLQGINAIRRLTGWSEATILNKHLFDGLPMTCVEGIWCGRQAEIFKWMEDNK